MMSPTSRRPLILDLDFTLLHLEYVPDAIEVPGRTRSAWIAPQTVRLLEVLQSRFEIILATARSWDGTRWVSDGLAERGVTVSGLVLEDGAMWGQTNLCHRFCETFDVEGLHLHINEIKSDEWPSFQWQFDFKACLVARCDSVEEAARLSYIFAHRFPPQRECRLYRDGRKVYLLPLQANKWSALQMLLAKEASRAAGVGDGINDMVWLPHVSLPCTFSHAQAHLVEVVREQSGYISSLAGHAGIADILQTIYEREIASA